MRIFAAAALLLLATPALAATAVAVSVEELSRASDVVVHGRVMGAHARRSDDGARILTVVQVRTTAVLRGAAGPQLSVFVPGGTVGRLAQSVDAAPRFHDGEEVVVFLGRAGTSGYTVTGLAQGKFTVEARTARPDLSQLTFIRTSVGAGERRVEEMPLVELERRVRNTR